MLCHVYQEKNMSEKDKSNIDEVKYRKRSKEVSILCMRLNRDHFMHEKKPRAKDVFVIGECSNDGPRIQAGSEGQ